MSFDYLTTNFKCYAPKKNTFVQLKQLIPNIIPVLAPTQTSRLILSLQE